MIQNEAGKFAFSWAKLTAENKVLVVLLGVIALFGFMYFYDRNNLIESLKTQIKDEQAENKELKGALKTKDCVVVVITARFLNFAENAKPQKQQNEK